MSTVKKDIWARIDEQDVKRIDRIAKQLGLSRSATAGLLIKAELKQLRGNADALVSERVAS